MSQDLTHNDLHRDMGALEAGQHAMEKRLDRLEQLIEQGFAELRRDISDLKLRDGQRSALERAGVWLAGLIGGAVGIVVSHLWK